MGGQSGLDAVLAAMFARILPHLGERHRRLVCGAAARAVGHGGVTLVAELAAVSVPTVVRGAKELDDPPDPYGRTRREGGGAKRAVDAQPGLLEALDRLIDPDPRGDPESPLRWTTKSMRQLAEALRGQGFRVSDDTVARLLRAQGYRLQRKVKELEGGQRPDRDAQLGYINEKAKAYLAAGHPVVLVDAYRQVLRNDANGRTEQPRGDPVEAHGLPHHRGRKAISSGVDVPGAAIGWRSVGTERDTAAFAVSTLCNWWERVGRAAYPDASRLLVCADTGGSDSDRLRLWKIELARVATYIGLVVTVCHLPPVTSKWLHLSREPLIQASQPRETAGQDPQVVDDATLDSETD